MINCEFILNSEVGSIAALPGNANLLIGYLSICEPSVLIMKAGISRTKKSQSGDWRSRGWRWFKDPLPNHLQLLWIGMEACGRLNKKGLDGKPSRPVKTRS